MSHGGKIWMNEKAITLIYIITLGALYFLIKYLIFTFVSFADYRLAFLSALLVGTISSMIYNYLVKRWLRLEEWQRNF
jgi:ABC-type antimicrobial peptide transport system permease subunit